MHLETPSVYTHTHTLMVLFPQRIGTGKSSSTGSVWEWTCVKKHSGCHNDLEKGMPAILSRQELEC